MKPTACVLLLIVSISGTAGCVSKPTLKMFQIDAAPCYDRSVQAQTSVVDTHLHFRPFGGPAVPFEEVVSYLKKAGVLFATIYGIGQMLPSSSSCTYYLECPGTPVTPTLKNDFVNAANYIFHDLSSFVTCIMADNQAWLTSGWASRSWRSSPVTTATPTERYIRSSSNSPFMS